MNYIIFDTETTGLFKSRDLPLDVCPKIIELYAMKVDENLNKIDELDLLIDPEEKLTQEIMDITKISQAMVNGKGSIHVHWPTIEKFMFADDIVGWLGHNVTFDADMIYIEHRRAFNKFINARSGDPLGKAKPDYRTPKLWCSVEWCEIEYGRRQNLSDLYVKIFGQNFPEAHRARNDVEALQKILIRLQDLGKDLELPGQSELFELLK
jgi:DNA polymerase III alpha subunit (gram-positive type)